MYQKQTLFLALGESRWSHPGRMAEISASPFGVTPLPATQDEDNGGDTEEEEGAPSPVGSGQAWGRLLDPEDRTSQLELLEAVQTTIGRSGACTLRLNHPKVSSTHARLSHDKANAILEDLSTNGTYVNGIKVGKGRLRVLTDLDEISFVAPTAVSANECRFVYVSTATECADPAVEAPTSAAESTANEPNRPTASLPNGGGVATASSSTAVASAAEGPNLERELTCGICQDILHRPVALQPCMHSFCGGCFSVWVKRKAECPQCRQSVRVVSRNHALANIVESFVSAHPERRRDPEETARLDQQDELGSEPRQLRKRERDDGGEFGDLSDEEESDDAGESDDNGELGGRPLAGAIQHVMAIVGARHMDQLAAALLPCAQCARRLPSALMAPLQSRQPTDLPRLALGNEYERTVLVRHLEANGLSVAQLLEDCLCRATPAVADFTLEPILPGQQIDVDGPTCNSCFERIFCSLAYQYRLAIPPAELPEHVTRRPDCWYGQSCRTQRHNPSHAERLNHVCQPTRGAAAHGAASSRANAADDHGS